MLDHIPFFVIISEVINTRCMNNDETDIYQGNRDMGFHRTHFNLYIFNVPLANIFNIQPLSWLFEGINGFNSWRGVRPFIPWGWRPKGINGPTPLKELNRLFLQKSHDNRFIIFIGKLLKVLMILWFGIDKGSSLNKLMSFRSQKSRCKYMYFWFLLSTERET